MVPVLLVCLFEGVQRVGPLMFFEFLFRVSESLLRLRIRRPRELIGPA